jgi:hypothetical protein
VHVDLHYSLLLERLRWSESVSMHSGDLDPFKLDCISFHGIHVSLLAVNQVHQCSCHQYIIPRPAATGSIP